jgi:transglycosylase-like protein with SLT domain
MRPVVRIVFLFALVLSSTGLFLGQASAASNQYASLIAHHASANGVPVDLAQAVVRHESNFNAHVTGKAGEVGLMQIKFSTARGIGFRGTRKQLYDPATNIAWGMKYLGQARKLAGGSECGMLSRYNGGLGNKRMIKSYCRGVASKSAQLRKAKSSPVNVVVARASVSKPIHVASKTAQLRKHKGPVQVARVSMSVPKPIHAGSRTAQLRKHKSRVQTARDAGLIPTPSDILAELFAAR